MKACVLVYYETMRTWMECWNGEHPVGFFFLLLIAIPLLLLVAVGTSTFVPALLLSWVMGWL